MEMENSIKQVATPDDAIDQFVGEQFMEWLAHYFDQQVTNWSVLDMIAESKPKPEKIKKFIMQRFLAEQAFTGGIDNDPGFLGFAIANLSESPEPEAEPALEILNRKKNEETGVNSQAMADWIKLLHAVGFHDEEIKRLEPKEATRTYISELSDVYSTAEWLTTVSAFYTHEKLAAMESEAISTMLKNNLPISDPDLHILAGTKADARQNTEIRHILEKSAVDQAGKELIFQGLKRQLDARLDFYTALSKYLSE